MTDPDDATKRLLAQQKRFGEYIANFTTNTCKLKAATALDVDDLDNRLNILEGYWEDYKRRDEQLQVQADTLEALSYFKEDAYTTTLNKYLEAKHWAVAKKRVLEATTLSPTVHLNGNAGGRPAPSYSYIQKVNLPTFAGDQREWDVFKEKFTALILHDENIPTVIKFEKLSGCVDGEAKQIVLGFPQLAAHFNSAWDALCSRFDNQVLRFNVHMQAIVQLPGSKQENASHISTLLATVKQAINIFTTLQRPVEHWGDLFVFFVESKLAAVTKRDWIKRVEAFEPKRFPTFTELTSFLEERLRTLDLLSSEHEGAPMSENRIKSSTPLSSSSPKDATNKNSKKTSAHVATHPQEKTACNRACSLCGGNHLLAHCKDFQAMEPTSRRQHVMKAKLCYNCLSPKHLIDECPSQHRCAVCKGKHHTRLHLETSNRQQAGEGTQKAATHCATIDSTTESTSCNLAASVCKTVLLSTACVTLQSSDGRAVTVRALLDTGAEESFFSEYIVQVLQLPRRAVHVAVSGIGGDTRAVAKHRVEATLKSPLDDTFELTIRALVLNRLTTILPHKNLEHTSWPHLHGLQLADPHFGTPSRIDCILNTEVYAAALRSGLRRGGLGSPIAMRSVFGWLVMGPTATNGSTTSRSDSAAEQTTVNHISVNHELTAALTKFWESEEVPTKHPWTPEEERCYEHFKATHRRNEQGRFVVRIPFKTPPRMSGTQEIAAACFSRLERRFDRSEELTAAYKAFIKEYEDFGHMETVSSEPNGDNRQTCYFPHHPVFKSLSKIRVVFNASQKDAQGASLNSFMHIGPKLQEDSVNILIG